MSDDISKAMMAQLAKDAELEKIKQETQAKKIVIDAKRVNFQMEQLEQNERDLLIAKNSTFGAATDAEIAQIIQDNEEYIKAAKNTMTFINQEFCGVVPFFRKNLILIGGVTGHGKSTTVANIAFSTINQRNPDTGKNRRVLIVTNEERKEDVYNRITCLAKGWHYTNHDKFTDEQVKTFNEFTTVLGKSGLVKVVDNNYGGGFGMTTTIEGISSIFDGLLRDREYYDVIIIDYYQNVKASKNDPTLDEWKVQGILAAMLDQYKNSYPAPIVLMAQVKAQEKEKNVPFEYRIKGRKIIVDPATHIMEMEADRPNLRTIWRNWKSRFNEAVGIDFYTGYDMGRFVEYSNAFIAKVNQMHEKKQSASLDAQIGIVSKQEDKENKE